MKFKEGAPEPFYSSTIMADCEEAVHLEMQKSAKTFKSFLFTTGENW